MLVNFIGWAGTIILIGAYALNSFGLIESEGLVYPILNFFAAIFLGIRVFVDKNYSNVILNVCWVGVTIVAIFRFFIF